MLDTRRELREFFDVAYKFSLKFVFTAFSISFFIAYLVAFIPEYNLSQEATHTLFILLFAAGLWISEAIPAFAVSLLVIALEIVMLGFPNLNFTTHSNYWQTYLQPWSSPLVFLFLAGFIMAKAAAKTELDIYLAKKVLCIVGNKPHNIITGLIGITFVLSMFISNTATAAMMLSIVIPLLAHIKENNPFRKSIFLAIIIGANLGGMATIIGTPPNAIAVGILQESAPSFIGWMFLALPPALFVTLILRFVILKVYPSSEDLIDLNTLQKSVTESIEKKFSLPIWKKYITMLLFSITILLWLTGPLHHIPTTVISLIPIIGFTLFGIIDSDDIATIRWDVIILIIGGLSLGLGVSQTGLDRWFANLVSTDGFSVLLLMFVFSYLVVIISNFMSNTAAANIMLPIVIAISMSISQEATPIVVVGVALSASFAMCLAVSTPPNAIIYASKNVASKDFLLLGLVAGVLGPLSVIGWLYFVNSIF